MPDDQVIITSLGLSPEPAPRRVTIMTADSLSVHQKPGGRPA